MQETSNLSFLPFLFFFQGVGAFKSIITLLVRSLLISFILFNELFIVITSAFPCCDWVLVELRFCFSFFIFQIVLQTSIPSFQLRVNISSACIISISFGEHVFICVTVAFAFVLILPKFRYQ